MSASLRGYAAPAGYARWTVAEDEFLAANYSLHGASWCAGKLGRTPEAVMSRAHVRRVSSVRPAPWSAEEDGLLRKCWALGGSVRELAARLGRTERACYGRASIIGLARKRPWRMEVA